MNLQYQGTVMPPLGQQFGGRWTDEKLEKLKLYLDAYMQVMSKQNFELIYIDAFAGSGFRQLKRATSSTPDLFHDSHDEHTHRFAAGSPRVALNLARQFDRYIFIDVKRENLNALRHVLAEFPRLQDRIDFRHNDANVELIELCARMDWRRTRAVAFLDPFAMQVNWATVEAIAETRSIDLWYLFPYMAVNRVLATRGNIPKGWRLRLELVLPDSDWQSTFYRPSPQESFDFVTEQEVVKDAGVEKMERYILTHLEQKFARVARQSLHLYSSHGQCLFLLTFASGNPIGAPIAVRIADHLIGS